MIEVGEEGWGWWQMTVSHNTHPLREGDTPT